MQPKFTLRRNLLQRNLLLCLFLFSGLMASQRASAHTVNYYVKSCESGPKYKVTADVSQTQSNSNYAWQYKNGSSWVCIVNGNNTINSNVYYVTGATSSGLTAAPIYFGNSNSALNGLVIRCIIADGSGVNPCNTSNTVYNTSSGFKYHTIDVSNTTCGQTSNKVLSLGSQVWYDKDNDGLLNNNEDGMYNLTMYLYTDNDNNDVADGAAIATDITDENGLYLFTNLAPGNYIVGVGRPAGYVSSNPTSLDPDNNKNWDNNGTVTVGDETRGKGITLSIGQETDGSGSTTTNINNTYDFAFIPDCSCTESSSNLLKNGSFETSNSAPNNFWKGNVTNSSGNSNFYIGTGYVACGNYNGFNDWISGTSIVYQDVTGISAGAILTFKGFAGVHAAGVGKNSRLRLVFFNGNTELSPVTETVVNWNVDENHGQLKQYTLTATVPANATRVQLQSAITTDYMKLDALCLTTSCTTPATPTYVVTDPTCSVATGTVALSNLPASGTWTLNYTYTGGSGSVTGSGTNYTFTNVAPGTYNVTVTNAGGCTSGAVSITVKAQPVTPTAPVATVTQSVCGGSAGTVLLTGLPATGSWTVTRTKTGSSTIVKTTGTGTTLLVSSLPAGTYTFTVSNADCSSPATTVVLNTLTGTARLSGVTWNDVNKNGLSDDGGLVLNNVLVSLYKDANADGIADDATVIASTRTSNGRYLFSLICPGNYVINFGNADGFVRTKQLNKVGNDVNDSDADPASGYTGTINLIADQLDNTNDAGYYTPTILPVSFGTMAAQARNCEVVLSFEVLTQRNTRQFEIQSSKDGSSWANIGIVSAKASSSTSYKYSFTHTQPAVGINLYRIKVVDNDGKISYSEVLTATSVCGGKGQITTYPNPAFDMLNVSLPAAYQDAQLQLFSATGQLVVSDAKKTGLVRSLNTGNLNPGIYLLKVVYNNNVVMTQKVIKGE